MYQPPKSAHQHTKIYNSKTGKRIIFNDREQQLIYNEQEKLKLNSLGYEINITSLTAMARRITEQKFFEIPPADYIPIRAGEGAWSSNIVTYRSFDIAGQFEQGIVNLGANNTRMAEANTAVDSVPVTVFDWGKIIGWSIPQLQKAARSGNWDLVTSLEKSRKRNWDLGIQKIAFLGANNGTNSACLGLLNQQGITTLASPSWFPTSISKMTTAQLKAFTQTIIEQYRSNCQRTTFPTHFVIPESDYNGIASTASPDFPIKSTLELLQETFRTICRNPNFKILPLAYADGAYGLYQNLPVNQQLQIYTLYRSDEESLRMDIPVPYTTTVPNSVDNYTLQNVGYGEFTGVMAYRPLEMLYITFPTTNA